MVGFGCVKRATLLEMFVSILLKYPSDRQSSFRAHSNP